MTARPITLHGWGAHGEALYCYTDEFRLPPHRRPPVSRQDLEAHGVIEPVVTDDTCALCETGEEPGHEH